VGVADPGFLELVGELDAELRETYPVLQDAYDKLNTLSAEALVVLLYADGLPVACGCVRPYANSTWEVKRMFVRKDYRGKGFSRKVLGELEAWAAEMGGTELILETGVKQLAAISLYEESGFLRMDNYGEYEGNENSVCMKKVL
jgi:GNAT superfamily N-acetyltransferase